MENAHILAFVYVIFLGLCYVPVIRICSKQNLSSFQGGKQKENLGVTDHTISGFQTLVSALFFRKTCVRRVFGACDLVRRL